MKFLSFYLSLYTLFIFDSTNYIACSSGSLEQISDDDLLSLIRSENYVSVLFTKNDCEKCDKLEDVLYHIREDLVDSLNAWVVKVVNSQLVRTYNPSKEPSLVFFRHGVPLLYDGEINDELILHSFMENKEPCVRELNDETFEHLTQVSTGATTGDWFVLFYSTDCIECQNLQARWESVCSKLKTRLNIARINKQTSGRVTGRRFGVVKVPSFLLFKQGKLYRCNAVKYDVASLSAFPVETYLKARIEPVSPPKGLLEDVFLGVLEFVREFSILFKFGTMVIGVLIVVSVVHRVNSKKEDKKSQKRSKTK